MKFKYQKPRLVHFLSLGSCCDGGDDTTGCSNGNNDSLGCSTGYKA